jgi:hypothetical protein
MLKWLGLTPIPLGHTFSLVPVRDEEKKKWVADPRIEPGSTKSKDPATYQLGQGRSEVIHKGVNVKVKMGALDKSAKSPTYYIYIYHALKKKKIGGETRSVE